MVEGPGCTRNGEKLRRSVVGHRVVGVAGGAGPRVAPSIRGKVLIDAMTLGKQLWMIFGDETGGRGAEVAVRCHSKGRSKEPAALAEGVHQENTDEHRNRA